MSAVCQFSVIDHVVRVHMHEILQTAPVMSISHNLGGRDFAHVQETCGVIVHAWGPETSSRPRPDLAFTLGAVICIFLHGKMQVTALTQRKQMFRPERNVTLGSRAVQHYATYLHNIALLCSVLHVTAEKRNTPRFCAMI